MMIESFSYTNGLLTLAVRCTVEQALSYSAQIAYAPGAAPAPPPPLDVARTGRTSAAAPNVAATPREEAPPPREEPDHAHGARRIGPPPPRVDDAAIASAAATSTPRPKADPKPKAETRRARAAPPPAEDEREEIARGADPDTIIEDEEDIPHAEAKPAKANGTNGHARPALALAPPAADAGEIDPALINAKKLGDVLKILIDSGITDVEDIKARCAELRPHCKVLQRITALDERIVRTLEVDVMDEVS